MSKHSTINRKWLGDVYKEASRSGDYFKGSNPRDIAHGIAAHFGMHPSYVGKLDQLITKLVNQGIYVISAGQLTACEAPVPRYAAKVNRKRATTYRKTRNAGRKKHSTKPVLATA